jgi:hypothetical protein
MAVSADVSGRKSRFKILRRDIERKILGPLRIHNWVSSIEREVNDGEYIIVAAARAGVSHKLAVFYTSATANDAYRRAAEQVDHIFVNGALYMVESFAYGLSRPVETIDDFGALLLKWNAATANGKFAPIENALPSAPATRRPFKVLQSEQPIESIWLHLRQLQSVILARKLIEERSQREGRVLDADVAQSKADGVAYALRNASDYFQSSDRRNVSQRVLNLYYGSLAFAFAEILAAPAGPTNLAELEDATKQGHGLYTLEGESGGIERLIVGIISNGFFPTWMKAMGMSTAQLPGKKPRCVPDLANMVGAPYATVERLFSAIPEIADLFADIFDSAPAWIEPQADMEANFSSSASTKVIKNRSYIRLVDEFGRLTPNDIAELPGPISEIAEIEGSGDGRHFRVAVDHAGFPNPWGVLDLHHSPFKSSALLMPVLGNLKCYRATCVVILYALSIVVRYRPSLWRRIQEGDLDHVRVLIEAFLFVVERVLPEQFLEKILGQRVDARQPGFF